jgi:competence protein ComEA
MKERVMRILTKAAAVVLLCLPMLALAGPVDVNTADAETMSTELKGVGLSKAKAIVEYRKKHGPFRSADDLSLVKGIGERTVELNRSNIKVSAPKK